MAQTKEPDLLLHWPAIGAHLGVKPDAARHLAKVEGLPTFKIGKKTVAASRASINAWVAAREAEAQRIRSDG